MEIADSTEIRRRIKESHRLTHEAVNVRNESLPPDAIDRAASLVESKGLPAVWARLEPWQLTQLARLAKRDPERLEGILNTLWGLFPNLRAELAISAVDQGEATVSEAAEALAISEEEVRSLLAAFRREPEQSGEAEVVASQRGAMVEDSQMFVWEIVREYRKIGSIEALTQSFPGLTTGQLAAALRYAEKHPDEIEDAISTYEKHRQRRRDVYPFT